LIRFLGILSAIFIFTSNVLAEAPSYKIGADISLSPQWSGLYFDTPAGLPVKMDDAIRGSIRTGGFLEMRYFRFDISYVFTTDNLKQERYQYSTNGAVTLTNTNSRSFLSLGALFKVPFVINDKIGIWPAAGLEYQFCLFSGYDGTNALTNSYDNRHGLWLKIGAGADVELFPHFFIIPSLFVSCNLLPVPYFDTVDDPVSVKRTFTEIKVTAYSLSVEINLGLGLEF
jgi:hypothetical protein